MPFEFNFAGNRKPKGKAAKVMIIFVLYLE